jgi:hypothetical protein
MISPAAAELIRRAKEQVTGGIGSVNRGDPLAAEVRLRAALASMDALEAHLNEPDRKPLRKMALVVMPRDEELPEWMERKR